MTQFIKYFLAFKGNREMLFDFLIYIKQNTFTLWAIKHENALMKVPETSKFVFEEIVALPPLHKKRVIWLNIQQYSANFHLAFGQPWYTCSFIHYNSKTDLFTWRLCRTFFVLWNLLLDLFFSFQYFYTGGRGGGRTCVPYDLL